MPTDAELLDQYRRTSDAAAFAELSRRYRDMVFASARRVTGDRHDAEDVAQTCFLQLARSASAVTVSVAAYLHRAATSRARNVLRARSRRRNHEQRAAADRATQVSAPAGRETPWELVAPEIDASIESLPEHLRVPVILAYLRGLSEGEIASELNVSRRVVERRLRVGVRQLRIDPGA